MSKKVIVVLCVALSFIGGVAAGAYAREAHMYAITHWIDECPAGDRAYWDDMCDAWYDEITDCGFTLFGWCLWGHCGTCFSKDRSIIDDDIRPSLFAEETLFSWARDRTYLDEGDAAMICLHGGDDGGYWQGKCRKKSDGDCYINARTELRVGDYDLEFLHLSSCHSLDDNMIPNAYNLFRTGTGGILHQLDGFHGCMWIGSSFPSDYEDFADDAFDMSIGLAWMENMYRTNINGQYTQCPIAYAVGRDCSDCINRLTTERYNNMYSDPTSIGCYCYYYYPGCDPDCESTFGSDWNS